MGVTGFKREERRGRFTLKNSLEEIQLFGSELSREILARIVVNFSVWTNDKTVKIKGVLLSFSTVFENIFLLSNNGFF